MSQKEQKIKAFDPNGIGHPNGNLFGLPFTPEESEVVIIPVPWDVTASFRRGAANGPAAVLESSYQIDLYDEDVPDAWKVGIAMLPISIPQQERNRWLGEKAAEVIRSLEKGDGDPTTEELQREVNLGCQVTMSEVHETAAHWLRKSKLVGVLGGDHSAAFGLMRALRGAYSRYGVLHIDAHLDLRNAFEGFEHSHASVMRNARDLEVLTGDISPGLAIDHFVHVGIRDYCDEEVEAIAVWKDRHAVFTERNIRRWLFEGKSWQTITDKMIRMLPERVYISFDIDGLDPSLCPNTGTPVPGGFSLEEVFYLVSRVVDSGRIIIGFDLCEVAPASPHRKDWASDWNANVGMRVLYRLSALAAKSCGMTS